MTLALRVLDRLDARDRGLYDQWALGDEVGTAARRTWLTVTHAGGAASTIGAAALPLFVSPLRAAIGWSAMASLVISHLVVQAVKRSVGRPRPDRPSAIPSPDRFSFPSGHAASSLAVLLSYALAFPAFGVPLVAFGLLVGASRVVLGVHYPGDVLAGQLIATGTVLGVQLLS